MRIRYAALLPLLHLSIATPSLFREEATAWRYIPIAQAEEEFANREQPSDPKGTVWSPCYEYRMPSDSRVIVAADLPAALLVGTSASECSLGAIRPLLYAMKPHVSVRTRVAFFECAIIFGILSLWYLIGLFLDRRRQQLRPLRRWIIPVVMITVAGVVAAAAALLRTTVAELVNTCSALVALLGWTALVVMFIVTGAMWSWRRTRSRRDAVAS
jgi:hypothetical protein